MNVLLFSRFKKLKITKDYIKSFHTILSKSNEAKVNSVLNAT